MIVSVCSAMEYCYKLFLCTFDFNKWQSAFFPLTLLTASSMLVFDDCKFLGSSSLVKVQLFCRHSVRTGIIFSVSLFGLFARYALYKSNSIKNLFCCRDLARYSSPTSVIPQLCRLRTFNPWLTLRAHAKC